MTAELPLSDMQLDTLREMINIGVGRAAATLNEMLDKHVTLSVPQMKIIPPDQLNSEFSELQAAPDSFSAVRLGFRGDFNGAASIVFPPDSAAKLVNILTDNALDSELDMDSIRIGTLSEVGNIVLNGVIGTLSNMMSTRLSYSLPSYMEDRLQVLLRPSLIPEPEPILIARANFYVEELQVQGVIYLVFEAGSFKILMNHIDMLG